MQGMRKADASESSTCISDGESDDESAVISSFEEIHGPNSEVFNLDESNMAESLMLH